MNDTFNLLINSIDWSLLEKFFIHLEIGRFDKFEQFTIGIGQTFAFGDGQVERRSVLHPFNLCVCVCVCARRV